MIAESRDWFELAYQRDPRLRPPGFDRAQLAPLDDGPTVALSRPVLRASVSPRPADPSPRVASRPDSGCRFEDVAERAGVRFQYEPGATNRLFIADTMGGGVALFDFDDDGWLDIYFVNGCALPYDRQSPPRPNKLYRNRRDGTFEDVTERAGVGGQVTGWAAPSPISTTTATTTCS